MKKIFTAIALVTLLLLSGCTTSTEFGACVGLGDHQNPKLEYRPSVWNIFLGIFGFELIAPPIFVAVDEFYCPVGVK